MGSSVDLAISRTTDLESRRHSTDSIILLLFRITEKFTASQDDEEEIPELRYPTVKCRTRAKAVMLTAAAATGRMASMAANLPLTGPVRSSTSSSAQLPNILSRPVVELVVVGPFVAMRPSNASDQAGNADADQEDESHQRQRKIRRATAESMSSG